MTQTNKILTVSYGTFSCTLEGFDDNFETMKAIAEYFRDLAADDRYFGAEPPQPDAEMLTRIAEREISRRVEARQHEGRYVLSAAEPSEAEANVAPPVDETPAVSADDADQPGQDIVVDATASEPAPDTETVSDTVSDTDTAPPSQASETADSDAAHPDPAAEGASAPAQAEPVPSVDTDHPSDTADDIQDADPVAAADTPPSTDSIASKLQRIRDVVSSSQQKVRDDEMFEDEHAEDFAPQDQLPDVADAPQTDTTEPETVAAQAAEAIEDSQRIDDAVQSAPAPSEDDESDDIAAILSRIDRENEESKAARTATTDPDPDMGLDTLAGLMAADDDQPMSEDDDSGENIFDDSETQEKPPLRARIVKVKRADIDAALASGALEEVDAEGDDDFDDDTEAQDDQGREDSSETRVAPVDSTLSADQEAELAAELAQVEAELGAQDATAEPSESPSTSAREAAAKAIKDDDVSRLMAEADNQMDEPEGSQRRNAFAHLKAAVMAKKADADIGNDSIKDEGAFRDDLATVVKPRHPNIAPPRPTRGDAKSVPPLKLVAEQRVYADDTPAAPAAPVSPRRVTAQPAAAQNSDSFGEYAAEMGAESLPALLEAAASYLSFVQGRDDFSRPLLMNTVRKVKQDDFSREAGLRSFGQLLRAGKIEKLKGGRFAVTSDIGYRPDERAAG